MDLGSVWEEFDQLVMARGGRSTLVKSSIREGVRDLKEWPHNLSFHPERERKLASGGEGGPVGLKQKKK